jgi:putative nucleotidyltransferase with HDIG domain
MRTSSTVSVLHAAAPVVLRRKGVVVTITCNPAALLKGFCFISTLEQGNSVGVGGVLHVRLPWHREPVRSSGLARAVSALSEGDGPDARGDETARGVAILESHQVETAELGALAKLPPFRPVAISLLKLFDRDDVKNDEIARLVESDPTLTSELLAVVNSPMFGFRTTIASPAHAISLLGMERTKSLVFSLAMRSMLQGGPRGPVVRRFWLHSIAAATVAQQIVRFFPVDPHVAHVGALLHDLGRLGLLAAHPAEYEALALTAYESKDQIVAAEQAAFGMTHCQAGALLAKAWSLPEPLPQIVAHHLDAESDSEAVSLVHLCCRLADDLLFQAILRHDIYKPEDTIVECAPVDIQQQLIRSLEGVNKSVIDAIEALDL